MYAFDSPNFFDVTSNYSVREYLKYSENISSDICEMNFLILQLDYEKLLELNDTQIIQISDCCKNISDKGILRARRKIIYSKGISAVEF